ncbi:MAG: hypothetical protein M1814_005568 [Vezdaea aestivalis]|nr:MAG: hypothetical protein M1814_005568 [Vezdaea aestivalis]
MAKQYEAPLNARQDNNVFVGDGTAFPPGIMESGLPKVDASPRMTQIHEPPLATVTTEGLSATIIPNTALVSTTVVTTVTAAPNPKTDMPTTLNDNGGPSRSQIVAAIVVPTILIFFVILALLCVRRRRKQDHQRAMNAHGYAKELGPFDSQPPPPRAPLPQIPMPAVQPSLSLSISTRFNAPQHNNPQRVNVTYYSTGPRPTAPRQTHQHRHNSSSLSRKPMAEDLPPPYMPRICTTPEGIPITQMAPARLTEANLARQDTSPQHFQAPSQTPDDAVSDVSGQINHNCRHGDNMSVVSDISYRGQAPTAVHQTV